MAPEFVLFGGGQPLVFSQVLVWWFRRYGDVNPALPLSLILPGSPGSDLTTGEKPGNRH